MNTIWMRISSFGMRVNNDDDVKVAVDDGGGDDDDGGGDGYVGHC